MQDPIHLTDAALEALGISPLDMVDAVERAVVAKTSGSLWAAPKTALMPGDGRYTMATLSTSDTPPLTVVKSVTSNPESVKQGLPAINGAILVLDSRTGLLKATMGANWITASRTAAISAVAARRMADPQAQSLAFIGTGVQARIHLQTFAALFPLKEIRVSGRGRANIDALLALADKMGIACRVADTPEDAIRGAELVVTSVPLDYTIKPFLDGAWLAPGAFASFVDHGIPWIPDSLSAVGTFAIDDHTQEAESDLPLIPRALPRCDLAELVAGPVLFDPGKSAVFAFRGMALGDFAAAALVVEKLGG